MFTKVLLLIELLCYSRESSILSGREHKKHYSVSNSFFKVHYFRPELPPPPCRLTDRTSHCCCSIICVCVSIFVFLVLFWRVFVVVFRSSVVCLSTPSLALTMSVLTSSIFFCLLCVCVCFVCVVRFISVPA